MSAWIFLLLAWLAGFTAPSQDPAPSRQVTCPTCDGSGAADQACLRCKGEGNHACLGCSPYEPGRREADFLEALAKLIPGDGQFLARAKTLRSAIAGGEMLDAGTTAAQKEPLPRGALRCPICASRDPASKAPKCKVCSGTKRLECSACKGKGQLPCGECQRKGTQRRPCETCGGAKKIPRPTAQLSDELCPWCGRDGWRACVQCDAERTRATQCLTCGGTKSIVCRNCAGTRKARCQLCMGKGIHESTKPGGETIECRNCHGSGAEPCTACKSNGKQPCKTCEEKGSTRTVCESCFGTKKALCAGCADLSARAWEASADSLLAAGAREEALAYWKIVESRTERRFATLLEKALSDGARKDLEKARTAELARVRKRIEALKG